MQNIPHRRFRNTVVDLNECQYWLEALIHDEKVRPLSLEELTAAKELVVTCLDIVHVVCEAGDVCVTDEPDLAALLDKLNREVATR